VLRAVLQREISTTAYQVEVLQHQDIAGYTAMQHAAVVCMLLDHGGERSFEDVIDGLGEYTEEKPSAYSVLKSLAAAGVIHIAPMAPEINLMTTAPDATSYTGATVRARSQLMLYVWRQMEGEFRDRLREWHASQVRQMGGWVSAGQLGQVDELVC
jgi:hypothetical protein